MLSCRLLDRSRAGASGYWMKNSSAEELMRAIEVVLSGEIYVSPLITSRAVQRFAGPKTQHSWSAGRS